METKLKNTINQDLVIQTQELKNLKDTKKLAGMIIRFNELEEKRKALTESLKLKVTALKNAERQFKDKIKALMDLGEENKDLFSLSTPSIVSKLDEKLVYEKYKHSRNAINKLFITTFKLKPLATLKKELTYDELASLQLTCSKIESKGPTLTIKKKNAELLVK